MTTFLKSVLVLSIVFNIFAVWGLFHYVMYGGSPISELKRKILGGPKTADLSDPYAVENADFVRQKAGGVIDPLRVVFLGASITRDWDLKAYFPEIHPVNRAIGGFASDLLVGYKANVLDIQPRAVVIKFCSINIRPQIKMGDLKDAMQMMVQLAGANDIVPVLATMIPAGKPAAHRGNFSIVDSILAFNDWVRDYARQMNLRLIDYAKVLEDMHGFLPRDYSIDPVHLNKTGYDIISDAARPVLHKALELD